MPDDDIDCGEFETLREFFLEGYFVRGWDCAMTGGDSATQLMFAFVIFGGVGLGLFVTTGSVVLPAVLGILFAGVLFALLPPTVTNIALVVLLLLFSVAGILLVRRIDRG